MVRAVLDTNVVVAGLRSRNGASAVILQLVSRGRVRPVLSGPLLDEYEEVLSRPAQRAAHGLSEADLRRVLRGLLFHGDLVPTRLERRLVLAADPNDAIVAETAIDGAADYLVTHNIRHFAEVGSLVPIVRPADLLRAMALESKP